MPPGSTVTHQTTTTVTQHINATVYGPVAGGNIRVEHTTHHHAPVAHRWALPAMALCTLFALMAMAWMAARAGSVPVPTTAATNPNSPAYPAPTAPLTPVDSSALAAVGYDASTQQLYIQFTSKSPQAARVYTFCNVPPALQAGLLAAPSKGGYYNEWVRGRYGC